MSGARVCILHSVQAPSLVCWFTLCIFVGLLSLGLTCCVAGAFDDITAWWHDWQGVYILGLTLHSAKACTIQTFRIWNKSFGILNDHCVWPQTYLSEYMKPKILRTAECDWNQCFSVTLTLAIPTSMLPVWDRFTVGSRCLAYLDFRPLHQLKFYGSGLSDGVDLQSQGAHTGAQ